MHNYGVLEVVYNWFESYLSDRKQYCCVSNVCSDISCLKFGVPQGSELGPLLFLICISDTCNAVPNANVKLFADDTNLFVEDPDVGALNMKANCFNAQQQQWFIAN